MFYECVYPLSQNIVLPMVFTLLQECEFPSRNSVNPNGFIDLFEPLFLNWLQNDQNSTGFIRCFDKAGCHAPDTENPNGFLDLLACLGAPPRAP